MKLGRPISCDITMSGWHSDALDKAIQRLADQTKQLVEEQTKQLVIDSAKEFVSYLLTEDSTCYFTTTKGGNTRLRICAGTEPNDPEWDIDIKEVLELSDIEREDAIRLANYFNDITTFLRERAS